MSAPTDAEAAEARQNTQPWLLALCAACLALGVVVRLVQFLRCHSYWYDEAFLLINVFKRSALDLLGPLDENLVIPPAFLWLVRGAYLVLGGAEWAMRLPALVAGLLALACVTVLARRALDGPAWVWAVCLAALSMRSLRHACEVRPYTMDLLLTSLILLTTLRVQKRWSAVALLALACVGPWLSFPSLLSLGAASLVLAWQAWRRSDRQPWLYWLSFNSLVGLSLLALWYFSARHLYYPGMTEHWGHEGWGGFPNWSSPLALLTWVLASPLRVAEYTYQTMGVPLTILWGLGLATLFRRGQAALAILLSMPVGLAIIAGLLGKYPLADRTTMFAAPCVWLGAAVGLEVARRALAWHWQSWRGASWSYVLPAALLLLGLVHMGRALVKPLRIAEFREAYEYVQTQLQPGDAICAGEVSLYRIYNGLDAPLCEPQALSTVGKQKRVWLVSSLAPPGQSGIEQALQHLRGTGGREAMRRQFPGVEVLLHVPPGW